MLLLDSDLLIDVRRGTPAALAWIEAAGREASEVPAKLWQWQAPADPNEEPAPSP